MPDPTPTRSGTGNELGFGLRPDQCRRDAYLCGYALAVPNSAADGLVLWERHQTTFVNLIRIAFQHGGFLRLDALGDEGVSAPPTELMELGYSLEPI